MKKAYKDLYKLLYQDRGGSQGLAMERPLTPGKLLTPEAKLLTPETEALKRATENREKILKLQNPMVK